jgi:hypothetical protein
MKFFRGFSRILVVVLSIGLVGSYLYAGETKSKRSKINNLAVSDGIKLIHLAGKQRMISQRIAKDYLYKGKRMLTDKDDAQLKESVKQFKVNQKKLSMMVNDPDIKNLLFFVDMSLEELENIIKKPFNLDNAHLVLDLSESMLEGCQYIVDSVRSSLDIRESKIVAKSERQRMLAQLIAKYYIAYQIGIKDKNIIDQMKKTVEDFSKIHKMLMENKDNTATINEKLSKVDKLWKVVYKFYLNIGKGGLPFIVFTSTDDITKMMDDITNLYVELYQKYVELYQ